VKFCHVYLGYPVYFDPLAFLARERKEIVDEARCSWKHVDGPVNIETFFNKNIEISKEWIRSHDFLLPSQNLQMGPFGPKLAGVVS
jgi:hypothetical protein